MELIFTFDDQQDRLYLVVDEANPMAKDIEERGDYDGYCVWADDVDMPCRMPEPTLLSEFYTWFEKIFPDLAEGRVAEEKLAIYEMEQYLDELPDWELSDGTVIQIDSQSLIIVRPGGKSMIYRLELE
jgi:hypothetical protein